MGHVSKNEAMRASAKNLRRRSQAPTLESTENRSNTSRTNDSNSYCCPYLGLGNTRYSCVLGSVYVCSVCSVYCCVVCSVYVCSVCSVCSVYVCMCVCVYVCMCVCVYVVYVV